MSIGLGTSGFSYREWKPSFYPPAVPASRFLEHYASRLDAVEIDSTFYRLPTEDTLRRWAAATPEHFRFAIKAPQRITHRKALSVPSDVLSFMSQQLPVLGPRLAVVLYQLPPHRAQDLAVLAAFLKLLPPGLKAALEFRHTSWFTRATYRLLEKHGVAFCVNDNHEFACPFEITASHCYVRLRKDAYTMEERQAWCDRLARLDTDGIDVLAFVKHKDNPRAPLIALELKEMLARGREALASERAPRPADRDDAAAP